MLKKREFIYITTATVASAIAGCLNEVGGESDQRSTNSSDTQLETRVNATETQTNRETGELTDRQNNSGTLEPLSKYARIGKISYRNSGGFHLSAEPNSLGLGDKITVQLEYTGDKSGETSVKDLYIIQRRNNGKWNDLFCVKEGPMWTAQAIIHSQESGGFQWEFEASKDGFSKNYPVCTPVRPGEYRFVYWGMIENKSIAVRFEIT